MLVTNLLIYDPLIVFTIPVFAVICDWTEGSALLISEGSMDPADYLAMQHKTKKRFLWVSTTVIVLMWFSFGFDLFSMKMLEASERTLAIEIVGELFTLLIFIFVVSVTVMIIVLYIRVLTVVKALLHAIKEAKDKPLDLSEVENE